MKRSKGFFQRNEKEVAKLLGMDAVPGSGSGWIAKEDLETDEVLAQLKSTDKQSYTIRLLDLEKLEYHATTTHKLPVFIIQFLQKNRLYALVDLELLGSLIPANTPTHQPDIDLAIQPDPEPEVKIKSSVRARDSFYKEKEQNGKRKDRRSKGSRHI